MVDSTNLGGVASDDSHVITNTRKRALDQLQSDNADLNIEATVPEDLLEYLESANREQSLRGKRRRHRSREPVGCCTTCHRMLEHGLQISECYPFAMLRRNSDGDFGFQDVRVATILVDKLENDAMSCSLCAVLLSILGGTDGSLLRQARVYENPRLNRFNIYDENGVTDVEAYTKSNHVRIVLFVCNRGAQEQAKSSMVIRFEIKVYTQRSLLRESTSSMVQTLPLFEYPGTTHNGFEASKGLVLDFRLDANAKTNWIRTRLLIQQTEVAPDHPTVLPARLLEISQSKTVRLVHTTDLETSSIPYVALSHRWGASQHMTATKHSLSTLLNGWEAKSLPSTFRDAIFFARHLGFAYIWIDALCIIQDSADDWLQESQKMGDVFTNAAVTFAVHCAEDDSVGFLAKALSKRDAVQHHVLGRSVGVCRPLDPERDITNSGLSKRGWVLQERFLSSRTLHFTPSQIYWETSDGILCEDGSLVKEDLTRLRNYDPDSDFSPPTSLFSPYVFPKLRNLLGVNHNVRHAINEKQTPSEWTDLIEMYSHCELTKETDKLVAIAGMARKIHAVTRQEWCAGIWADRLCEQLLWFPTDDGLTTSTLPRAPSWSWAARDGPIQYPFAVKADSFEPRCEFVQIEEAGGEPVKWLNELGALKLRGLLISMPVRRAGEVQMLGPGSMRKGDPAEDPEHDLPRLALRTYVNVRCVYNRLGTRRRLKAWMAIDNRFEDPWRTRTRYTGGNLAKPWFLVVGTYREHPSSMQGPSLTCLGLFLESVESSQGEVYKRIGAGQIAWTYVEEQLRAALPNKPKTATSAHVHLHHLRAGMSRNDRFATENLTTITLV